MNGCVWRVELSPKRSDRGCEVEEFRGWGIECQKIKTEGFIRGEY